MFNYLTHSVEPALKIGTAVQTRDAWIGTLEKVVVDPDARRVTHLVVRGSGPFGEQRVVPIAAIARVDVGGIHLSCSLADLAPVGVHDDRALVTPPSGGEPLSAYTLPEIICWRGSLSVAPEKPGRPALHVPHHPIMLRRDVDVLCDDVPVGTLDDLRIDPRSGQVTQLVVKERQTRRRVVVPQEWVRAFQDDAVILHSADYQRPGTTCYPTAARDASLSTDIQSPLIARSATATIGQHQRTEHVTGSIGGACAIGGREALLAKVGCRVVRGQTPCERPAFNAVTRAAVQGNHGTKWGRSVRRPVAGCA